MDPLMPRLIRTDSALQAVLPLLLNAKEISVDTEFHTEKHYYPNLLLVQLRPDDGDIFLVDPLGPIDLGLLAPVLATVPLLLHGGQMDIQLLTRATGVRPIQVYDTQIAAACCGQGYPIRLSELLHRNLGLNLSKAETLSDWSRRPLSTEQLTYAADDVRLLPALATALRTAVNLRGNTDIAQAAMEELRLQSEDLSILWTHIPGAQTLDGPGRAALQALSIWRETTAQTRNIVRTALISDGLLLDLARRRPQSIETMSANRRMPSIVWKRDGAALLEVLHNAKQIPLPVHGQPKIWLDLVRAAARVVEREQGVSVELLMPDLVLAALSHGMSIANWRTQALGPKFEQFLKGEIGIELPGRWTAKQNT